MFRILATLGSSDWKAVRSWFTTQTGSKIAVMMGFLIVLLGADILTYFGVKHLFISLVPFGVYGKLTADYIMKAAYVVIVALGIGSSIAASANLVFSPNRNNFYLSTLPVKEKYLILWLWLRTIVSNWFFLLLLLLPITLAYSLSFGQISLLGMISAVFLVGGVLAVFSNSLGGFIAYLTTRIFKKFDTLTTSVGVAVFVFVLIWIFRLVLPPELASLTTINREDFMPVYNNLPLVRFGLSFTWFVLATGLITALYLMEQNRNFLRLTKEMSARLIAPQFIGSGKQAKIHGVRLDSGNPTIVLVVKDLINLIRSPVEFSYGLFLLLMMFGFFILLSRVNILGYYLQEWILYLITFAYAGLVFFANTYFLRLVYPLLAREGSGSWYLFSLPVTGKRILNSKIITAFILCTPLLIASVGVWYILPFISSRHLILAASAVEIMIFICLFQLFSGAVWPNFPDGDNPERVSTSAEGLLTLAATSLVIFFSAWGIYAVLRQNLSGVCFLLTQTVVLVPVLALMYHRSVKAIAKYQF